MGLTLPGGLTLVPEIQLGFRFSVCFLHGGVLPNPLDLRFQSVKGLSATVTTTDLPQGGQNLYTQKLPDKVHYENLVLERGMVVGSPLGLEFEAAMMLFKFVTANVIVMLHDQAKAPVAAWMFHKAYPVKWSVSDLDATEPRVLIETFELAYGRMQTLRI